MLPRHISKITIHIEGISFGDEAVEAPRNKQPSHPLIGREVLVAKVQPEGGPDNTKFWKAEIDKHGSITQVIPHHAIPGHYLLDVLFPGEPFPHEQVWSKRFVVVGDIPPEMAHAFANP